MFKKSCQLSNQSLVSSKDKKTMIKSHNWCSGLNSFGQLMVSKLTGSKGRVYFVQSENEWIPAIVDSTGKLDIFPTIFYLWMSNEILPVVETNLGVSSYIMNGADLMWPGVRNFEMVKGIQLGTWVAIATRGNCMPYAVGKYLGYQGEDLKGKCVEVYHYYRDKLWETKPLMPNIGFTFDEVLPIAKPKPVEMSTPEVISEQDSTQSQVEESSQQSTQNLEETKEHSTQNEELRLTEETSELIPDQSQDAPEAESELTTEQADENLYRIFLTALKVGTTDDMIPLEPSALIQILSRCTGRLTLDIKKSSYKRVIFTLDRQVSRINVRFRSYLLHFNKR
jgi:predicted ribosome-associated RNA-binding protein Tma20